MLLFIDACVRGERSRTRKLADRLLSELPEDTCIRLHLDHEPIRPLTSALLAQRDQLAQSGDFRDPVFRYARQWAEADTIVIAAPYWDLAFPALLKIYLEQICVVGLTFGYTEQGVPKGLCRAQKLYYVTTAGGIIPEQNFGVDYIRQLAGTFFGIPDVRYLKAEKLDWVGEDASQILDAAMQSIPQIL